MRRRCRTPEPELNVGVTSGSSVPYLPPVQPPDPPLASRGGPGPWRLLCPLGVRSLSSAAAQVVHLSSHSTPGTPLGFMSPRIPGAPGGQKEGSLLHRKGSPELAASGLDQGREQSRQSWSNRTQASAPWPLAPSSPPTAGAGGEAALGHLPSQLVGFVEPHSDRASQYPVRTDR